MSNPAHEAILRQGVATWNQWRRDNPSTIPFLRSARLNGADLSNCDLHDAYLKKAQLRGAVLSNAKLREANLEDANLDGADLTNAQLAGANLRASSLKKAILKNANLRSAIFVGADLQGATLEHCDIFGIAAWDLRTDGCHMRELTVTLPNQPKLTVDDLEIASFLFLVLKNSNLRKMFDGTTSKVVLLLGGFLNGGLDLLHRVAAVLKDKGFVPILFDFARPTRRNYTETILVIAGLSAFVVAAIDGPSVPQEAHAITCNFNVPFVPLLARGREGYALFRDLEERDSVLTPVVIDPGMDLVNTVELGVIQPCLAYLKDQAARRARVDLGSR